MYEKEQPGVSMSSMQVQCTACSTQHHVGWYVEKGSKQQHMYPQHARHAEVIQVSRDTFVARDMVAHAHFALHTMRVGFEDVAAQLNHAAGVRFGDDGM